MSSVIIDRPSLAELHVETHHQRTAFDEWRVAESGDAAASLSACASEHSIACAMRC